MCVTSWYSMTHGYNLQCLKYVNDKGVYFANKERCHIFTYVDYTITKKTISDLYTTRRVVKNAQIISISFNTKSMRRNKKKTKHLEVQLRIIMIISIFTISQCVNCKYRLVGKISF